MWYLYLVRTADGRLYTGVSTDPVRRLAEHRAGGSRGARSLRGAATLELVARWRFNDKSLVHRAEARVKRLPKEVKEALVSRRPRPGVLLRRLGLVALR